jgi:hypothetical protein
LIAQQLALRERQLSQELCHAMNKPRVLLVDDDRSVLDALGAVIESEASRWSALQMVTRLSKGFASNPSTLRRSILNIPRV